MYGPHLALCALQVADYIFACLVRRKKAYFVLLNKVVYIDILVKISRVKSDQHYIRSLSIIYSLSKNSFLYKANI